MAALLITLAAPSSAAALSAQRTHGPDPAGESLSLARTASVASASDWCPNTDPTANQVDNGEYRYHSVYVHAADRPSRLAVLGAQLQEDALAASSVIEGQYGRAIRFDIGTPCGPDQLDISEVRLGLTDAQLAVRAAAGGTATFDAVAQALREHGFGVASDDEGPDQLAARRENFVVWVDGPAPARSCGQGTALLDGTRSETNLNNFGGKLAVIFRHDGAFCGPDVVRHEIGHNLGALQPDAPHTTDGVHCNDAFEDTMCGVEAPKMAGGAFNALYFDYGNDDYWDPPQGAPLGWWTLNLSRFICADDGCNRPATPAAPRAPAAAHTDRPVTTTARPARARTVRRARRPRLTRRVRHGDRYTRMRLRARGAGSARLIVKCPRRRHHRRVMRRRIDLPSVVRVRTTCRSPRAHLVRWHRPRAARFEMPQ